MGQIQEKLILTDDFTAAFTRFLNLGESAVRTTENVNSSIAAMGQSSNDIATAGFSMLEQKLSDLTGNIQEQSEALKALGESLSEINGNGFDQMATAIEDSNSALIEAIEYQSLFSAETEKTNNQAKKLLRTIKRIGAALGVTKLVKSFLDFSDTQTQITARLNLMNDGLQTTDQLNEMIYQSALRSKSAYSDTADAVGKMGLNAKNAFSSNQELIAFTEQVNKHFDEAMGQQF